VIAVTKNETGAVCTVLRVGQAIFERLVTEQSNKWKGITRKRNCRF